MNLEDLRYQVENCKKCELWKTRNRPVLGEGNPKAEIMFIGEAPGREEDKLGRPFVGAAGRLLDGIFSEIGIDREEVYITNVVKCRPPGNRQPTKREMRACSVYLDKQISIIRPKVIVALGNTAASYILDRYNMRFTSMERMHGEVFRIGTMWGEIKVLLTYHPAAAL
ncbi:uracil-DNA glycosylase, partial [Nanoarchaeota archaeon]